MGAMENKGLNVFNTACVLAAPQTATDGVLRPCLRSGGPRVLSN